MSFPIIKTTLALTLTALCVGIFVPSAIDAYSDRKVNSCANNLFRKHRQVIQNTPLNDGTKSYKEVLAEAERSLNDVNALFKRINKECIQRDTHLTRSLKNTGDELARLSRRLEGCNEATDRDRDRLRGILNHLQDITRRLS